MKKIKFLLAASALLVGLVAIPRIARAIECFLPTCLLFDSLSSVSATNIFDANSVVVIGLVGGIEKTVTVILLAGVDPEQFQSLNNCVKTALLAQVSPDKFQLSFQATQAEQNNTVTVSIPSGTPGYSCSLVSK